MPTSPAPTTILDLFGLRPPPGRLSDSTLVIIDAQREYQDGMLPLAGFDASLAVGARLLARARAAGTPVVHVVHRGAGPLFNPEGPYFQIVAPLAPLPGEAVIEKQLANSFTGTTLQPALQQAGRTKLIVIGYMTHNCVSSTVRAAAELGYPVTVVAAACATRDLPDGQGGVLPAAALHAACLAGLSDTQAVVVADDAAIAD